MKNKVKKIKQLIIVGLILFSLNVSAQDILQPANEKTYTEYVDKILENIKLNDINIIKNKILYDRVYPVAKLETFNDSINISNYNHFLQSWDELSRAKIDQPFMSIDDLEKIAYHYERQNIIQIGLINVDFSVIDTTALKPGSNQKLELINHKVNRIPNKNPYITKHALVISPLNREKLNGTNVNFQFGKFVLNFSDKKIKTLIAHFENNQDYILVDNSITVLTNFNVDFQNSGYKNITFDITYTDNSTQTTNAVFYINTSLIANRTPASNVSDKYYITATKPFQGYDEPSDCNGDCFGKGEYKIYFANGHTQITKPFIIVDGIDHGDKRKIDGYEAVDPDDENIYEMMEYKDAGGVTQNLINNLNAENYDVIILNFPNYLIGTEQYPVWDWDYWYDDYSPDLNNPDSYESIDIYRDGGADYIERNAKVVEALIDEINTNMASNNITNKIKIAGPSMGGLIVRYALSEMEENNENHNVDLYVSFDSPHKGANISIGLQKAIDYFNLAGAKRTLTTPAAKQMLINHYLSYSNDLPEGAPGFRNRFQNELDRIGFPQQSTNVAIINGSIIGEKNSDVAGNFVYADLVSLYGFLRRTVWINYTKNSGQKVVFRYLKRNWWGINTQDDIKKYSSSSSSFGSLDNSSGSYLDIKGDLEKEVGGHFPYYYFNVFFNNIDFDNIDNIDIKWYHLLFLDLLHTAFYVDMNNNFSFIPTKSSLAFSGNNNLWRECLDSRNLVCTGETPFDSYFAPTVNQEHVSLYNDSVTWLLSVINSVDNNLDLPNPEFYSSCLTSASNITIIGNDKLCLDDVEAYNFLDLFNCNNNYTVNWSTSNNLQIISSNNDEITVKAIADNGNKWITASTDTSSFTKKIIGKPSYNIQTESDMPMFATIEIIGDWIDINLQDIISITWTQTGGTGTLDVDTSSPYVAIASGQGNDWYVSGEVQITNSCGTTTKTFAAAPFMSDNPCGDNNPDNDYFIQKVNPNTYRVINPCQNYTQNINSSELYDIYGTKTNDIIPIQDKVDINNAVNSGELRVIKVNINGKVLTKTIITD